MKKILSLVLSIILIISCMGVVSARKTEAEKKTYIVVLEAPAVYSPDRVTFYGTDDDMYREALLELQAEVKAQINGGVSTYSLRNIERTYTYTDVLNGFTVNVDEATAEKIKAIEGVSGVYEDEIIDFVEPVETEMEETPFSTEETESEETALSAANSANMMNVQSAYDKGYDGTGRAIAVIDSTLNPDHPYYKLSDDTTAKYTQADIDEILESNTMNVAATAQNAYRNAKIPYAFNYPQDSCVLSGSNYHGAHVAGIVAGNSVTVSDGVIKGVAPEAQILFFGMYHPEGTSTGDIVAALEDAVKFDVDAVNISMGSDFASENQPLNVLATTVANCRNAGISVVFAAGNSDRAYDDTVMPDYGTSDNRAYRYSSKVGSVQAEYIYQNKAVVQVQTAPRESSSSSYGYADNLDIAVDFAAPGGYIYSSYSGNSFENMSGTSMAAPQVTGATCLMYQYAEEKFPTYIRAEKVALIKSLLASTAESVYTANGALSSPRKVGAGIIRLDKAMETKVMLRGVNSNETKINLGADLTNSFAVTFKVFNLSTEDITFNNINVDISADDYKYYEDKGYNYYGRKKLDATVSGASSVTVGGRGTATVTVDVTLSDEDISYLETAMTNGFFIDGKVTLSGSTKNCDVGIPFSGFYGDWSSLPIMNANRVLDYMSILGLTDDGFMPSAMITKENNQLVLPISDNVDESVASANVIFTANPLRNAYVTIAVDGVIIVENAFLNKEQDFAYYFGNKTLGDLSEISEIAVALRLPYYNNTSKNQSFTIKMVKDNTPPVISDMYVSDDGTSAYVAVSDNYGVSVVSSYGILGEELMIYDAYIGDIGGTAELVIEGQEDICYTVYDCAFNMITFEPHITIGVDNGNAIYTNNTHKPLSGDCMLAVYENGKMTEFKNLSEDGVTIEAYATADFDVSQYADKDYKLFFWSDMEKFVPICEAY